MTWLETALFAIIIGYMLWREFVYAGAVAYGFGMLPNLLPLGLFRIAVLQVSTYFALFSLLIMIVAIIAFPYAAAHVGGSLFIINFCISFWAIMYVLLSNIIRRIGLLLPAWMFVIAVVVLFKYFNLNDNRAFRQLDPLSSPPPALEDAFSAWLNTREDIRVYAMEDRAYPVYLVALEGGGIYAAAHAAIALARLHKTDPRFSEHLFAISAASGGSLGGAIYQQLVSNGKLSEGAVIDILKYDFLSPLLLRGLLHDALNNILPFPVSSYDRARGLEAGFEDALCQSSLKELVCANSQSTFSNSFQKHWDPLSERPGSALVLNTTEVSHNCKVMIAPFRLAPSQSIDTSCQPISLNDLSSTINIRMSTAIGLSARFPYVTSWGWLNDDKMPNRRFHFTDGGFKDNSGILSAHEIAKVIAQSAQSTGLKLDLSIISIRTAAVPDGKVDPVIESIMPIAILYSDWKRKSEQEIRDIKASGTNIYDIILLDPEKKLPLTWSLSLQTLQYIASNTESEERCSGLCGKAALKLLKP
jgi:hypothetical protein